jgi:hypothetical protein
MLEKELRKPIEHWLLTGGYDVVHEPYLCGGYCDIAGCKFTEQIGKKKPFLYYLIAIELKISDIPKVISQARCNLTVANESYAAMPGYICDRMRNDTFNKFKVDGIGLISVSNKIEIIVPAKKNLRLRDNLYRRRITYKDYIKNLAALRLRGSQK